MEIIKYIILVSVFLSLFCCKGSGNADSEVITDSLGWIIDGDRRVKTYMDSTLAESELSDIFRNVPPYYDYLDVLNYGSQCALDIYLKTFRELGFFNEKTSYYLGADFFMFLIMAPEYDDGGESWEMQEKIIDDVIASRRCQEIYSCDITEANASKYFESGGIITLYNSLIGEKLIISLKNEFPGALSSYAKSKPHYECAMEVEFKYKNGVYTEECWDLQKISFEYRIIK